MVRVYDDLIDVRDMQTGILKGSLRVILYLEDNGVDKSSAKKSQASSLNKAREMKMNNSAANMGGLPQFENGKGGQQTSDY